MGPSTFIHLWQGKSSECTLVLLHGTGGNESDLVPLAEMIDPNASLLGLRGNSREEGVNRFFKRRAEGLLDEDDILIQTKELRLFLVEAAVGYGFSLENTLALGYSNGANIAASLLLLYPRAVAGAILLRPMAPFKHPPTFGEPIGPVLVLSGSRDSIIPASETDRLIEQLESRGSEVTVVSQNAGHELVRNDVVEAEKWLRALGLRREQNP